MTPRAVGIAVVGAGRWGGNVVRAFSVAPGADLRWVCDRRQQPLDIVAARFPGVRTTRAFDAVIADPQVEAIVIAADAAQHYPLARAALRAGRHVLVEKPLALSSADARALCGLAEAQGLTLMVGHLLLYHPAIARVKAAVDAGELGELLYLHTRRVNLGVVRRSENAWWSLAPHDIAVALHLLGELPLAVSATGAAVLDRPGSVEDVVFASLFFGRGRIAHLHVSWLDPEKRRSLTVVGSQRMLTFDDAVDSDRFQIHDKSAQVTPAGPGAETGDTLPVSSGQVITLDVPHQEPLIAECEHFLSCVRDGIPPRSDGRQGLDVVRILEAGDRSLRAGGARATVGEGEPSGAGGRE